MAWKNTTYYINNCDPGHTRLTQQFEKTLKITFTNSSKKALENKKKEKKIMAIAKCFALHADAYKVMSENLTSKVEWHKNYRRWVSNLRYPQCGFSKKYYHLKYFFDITQDLKLVPKLIDNLETNAEIVLAKFQ